MSVELAKKSGKKVFALIDGKSVFYRGYYAMPNLSTKDGTPTGGVYGFASLALELVNRIQPDYVAVAWDKSKTSIRRRRQIYSDYKANRHTPPEDFFAQIPVLHKLLQALGWPLYEADDYEADDIMGTLARLANEQDIYVVLISSDLDMLQLVNNKTELYAMKKGLSNLEKFDLEAFENKYQIRVDQFLDLKSLKGDSSDNIPGVAGVGEKTAIKLLQEYDTLDEIYQNISDLKGALANKLIKGKESAYMSKRLGKIWLDAPMPLDLRATNINNLDRERLHQELLDLQFNSLIKRLPSNMSTDHSLTIETDKTLVPLDIVNRLADTSSADDGVLAVIYQDDLYLSFDYKQGSKISWREASQLLSNKKVVAHDLKLLAKSFLSRGLPINFEAHFDTKHAGFLLDSLRSVRSLPEHIADFNFSDINAGHYLAVVYQLWNSQRQSLADNSKMEQLAYRVDFPLQIVLAKMEDRGVAIDVNALSRMSQSLEIDLSKLTQDIYQFVGREFNLASPKQLSEALFNDLELKPTARKNKSGYYPTGAKELTKLINVHPSIRKILDYRELSKLKSTYVDALPKVVGLSGRIHTTFDQNVTATGRLSSSNPNLQNIPTRTERGRKIKEAFVASRGKVLVSADYAQFELRLAAALANDQKLIEIFNDSHNDVHTRTAAEAYGVSDSEVTTDQRRHAKVINFGVLYGMSPHGLMSATDMNFTEAKQFIDNYFKARQPIRDYLDNTLKQAEEQGFVETILGRRRPTPDVKSKNFMVREGAKRAAMNMPIQGSEADLMKMAMIEIEKLSGASQIMQVHDSIMIECDPDKAESLARQMKNIMENIYPDLGVNLLVEVKIGHNWSEL